MKLLSVKHKRKNTDKGFTLVEILVTLTIMSILAAAAVPTFSGFVREANGKAVRTECTQAVIAAKTLAREAKSVGGSTIEQERLEKMAQVPGFITGVEIDEGDVLHLYYGRDGMICTYCRDYETCLEHDSEYVMSEGELAPITPPVHTPDTEEPETPGTGGTGGSGNTGGDNTGGDSGNTGGDNTGGDSGNTGGDNTGGSGNTGSGETPAPDVKPDPGEEQPDDVDKPILENNEYQFSIGATKDEPEYVVPALGDFKTIDAPTLCGVHVNDEVVYYEGSYYLIRNSQWIGIIGQNDTYGTREGIINGNNSYKLNITNFVQQGPFSQPGDIKLVEEDGQMVMYAFAPPKGRFYHDYEDPNCWIKLTFAAGKPAEQ